MKVDDDADNAAVTAGTMSRADADARRTARNANPNTERDSDIGSYRPVGDRRPSQLPGDAQNGRGADGNSRQDWDNRGADGNPRQDWDDRRDHGVARPVGSASSDALRDGYQGRTGAARDGIVPSPGINSGPFPTSAGEPVSKPDDQRQRANWDDRSQTTVDRPAAATTRLAAVPGRGPVFDNQNVNHQIDLLRRHIRTLIGHSSTVPAEMGPQNDMGWQAAEDERLAARVQQDSASVDQRVQPQRDWSVGFQDDVNWTPAQRTEARHRYDEERTAAGLPKSA